MNTKKIIINKEEFEIIGMGIYSSKGNPESKQIKVFLEGHKSLMILPDSKIAYFGIDKGEIQEFNGFPPKAVYNGNEIELVNHDYQLEDEKAFGITEGECEFWDYEGDDNTMFVSVAVLTDSKKRSDVELKLIDIEKIEGLNKIISL